MEGPHPARFPSGRGWLVYVGAWLPYLAVYVGLYMQLTDRGLVSAAGAAGLNILPDALLGIAVLRRGGPRSWPPPSMARFAAIHLAAGVGFAIASMLGKLLAAVLLAYAERGVLTVSSPDAMVVGWQLFVGVLIYAVLVSAVSVATAAHALRQERVRAANADLLRTRAELEGLRGRLNPHLLFNTLHSLLALIRSDPDAAERGIEQLGDCLRYALRVDRDRLDTVLLGEEWAFVRQLLQLEQLRLGDRLRLDATIDEAVASWPLPPFSLQILVDNAVRHGVAPRAGGGSVQIRGTRDADMLLISVRDDGPGRGAGTGSGIGLDLLRRRLRLIYGARASLELSAEHGFCAQLRVPAIAEPEQ